MTDIPFGAVVLTDFPFTDLSAAKRRPALVLSADNDRRTDVIVAYITSVSRSGPDAAPPCPDAGERIEDSFDGAFRQPGDNREKNRRQPTWIR